MADITLYSTKGYTTTLPGSTTASIIKTIRLVDPGSLGDLTDANVYVVNATTGEQVLDGEPLEITDAAARECTLELTTDDLLTPGRYRVVISSMDDSGVLTRYPGHDFLWINIAGETRRYDRATLLQAQEEAQAAKVDAVAAKAVAEEKAEVATEKAEDAALGAEVSKNARDVSILASEASGVVRFFGTWAEADTARADGEISEGDVVHVWADENQGGLQSRYQVESGALAGPKVVFAQTWIDVRTFAGVDPTGVEDSTEAIQTALDETEDYVLVFPKGTYKITSGLTRLSGPILMLEGAKISASGTGYTALTIGTDGVNGVCNPFQSMWKIYLEAAGQDVDGLKVFNWAGQKVDSIRVNNFGGHGVYLQSMWDTVIDTVSVERCGTSAKAAFRLKGSGSDTSNESVIGRLQVEQANGRAILVDSTCLNVRVNSIHSERAVGVAGQDTWSFNGAHCYYGNLRLNAASGDATLVLAGEHTEYDGVRAEKSTATTLTVKVAVNNGYIEVDRLSTGGNVTWGTGHNSRFKMTRCSCTGTFTHLAQEQGALFDHCKFTSLIIQDPGAGITRAGLTANAFRDCEVTTLAGSGSNPAALFVRCKIAAMTTVVTKLVLDDCDVTAPAFAFNYGQLTARDTRFTGDVSLDLLEENWIRFVSCHIQGDLTNTNASSFHRVINQGSRCDGVVSASLNGAPQDGALDAWAEGDSTQLWGPSVGGKLGYVYSGGAWQTYGVVGMTQAAAQADSVAADVATLKADLNALLAKLRTAKIIAT